MLKLQDHFETLTTSKMEEIKVSLTRVAANDVHRVALLQGTFQGLALAQQLYREAARKDADPDGVGA